MRNAVIAGLMLGAALAFAGQGLADDKGGATPVNRSHNRHKHPGRAAETQPPTYLRIPANPVIRDCVHVMFPQCSGRGGLNDGAYGLPY
jgi:hypothetical protein